MSLLLDAGHSLAGSYPIGMLGDEAQLVVERLNQEQVTRATLLQMAVSGVLSKDGAKAFKEAIDDLLD